MTAWRTLLITSLGMILIAAAVLLWEARSPGASPAATASMSNGIFMTSVSAGGGRPATQSPDVNTHEELSSNDISEGKRLYQWYNCNTCHANGGGNMGPALMDDKWIYGSEAKNIVETILEGRPNGMPSFRGKIPDAQAWQIAAYVRSLSGHVPSVVRSTRTDDISAKAPENSVPKQPVNHEQAPTQ